MELGFDRDDILEDIAEHLRAEQGAGFKKTLFYKILDKIGIPLTTTKRFYNADNLPDYFALLTLVKLFGPAIANRSFVRLGYKVVPLGGGEVDAKLAKALVDDARELLDHASLELQGAPKLVEVKRGAG